MKAIYNLIFGVTIFFGFNSYSQSTINEYKYIVVPEGYAILKGDIDKYQLNSLTKFLFNKYGFTALIQGNEIPQDLASNGCLALNADVIKNSGLFTTKLIIELKNCSGVIVFKSSEGVSREKDYKKAYHEALRDAFKDIQKLNYKYQEKNNRQAIASNVTKDTTTQPQSSETLKKNVASETISTAEKISKPVDHTEKKQIGSKKEIIATTTDESISYTFNEKHFIFKKQEYGYELIENKGENKSLLGKIFKSNRDNSYIVKAGTLSGNGYFDAYGNFLLERINPVTNKIITDTFARQ